MANESERMQILEMNESGKITPAEGMALLNALEGGEADLPEEASGEDLVQGEPVQPSPSMAQLARPSPDQEMDAGANVYPPEEPVEIQGSAPGAEAYDHPAPPMEDSGEPVTQGEVISPPSIGPDFSRWRRFWQIPLWVGVGITVVSGILMLLAWQGGGFGFWFACTWLPFLLGVAVMALAWSTRNLPWLHVRIQQKQGERPQNINISLPLPLSVIGWALRTFKHKIPDTGNVNLDEMVMALKHVTPDAPFSVDVDEGQNGERVQIYIG